jgi:hypothetical protein
MILNSMSKQPLRTSYASLTVPMVLALYHRAIRMRMYAKQKAEAQKQLEDPKCEVVRLTLDIECRLVSKSAAAAKE